SATVAILRKNKIALLKLLSAPPNLLRASYVRQYVTCGKQNCRCRRGFKHGPFFYLVQSDRSGKIRKFLLKTAEQRQEARRGIDAHKAFERRLAELSRINTELLWRANSLRALND